MRLGMISDVTGGPAIDSPEGSLVLELWQLIQNGREPPSDDINLKDARSAIMVVLRINEEKKKQAAIEGQEVDFEIRLEDYSKI